MRRLCLPEEPAHPALVSREEFEAAAARAASNHRSRQGGRSDGGAVTPPKREYLYRGHVRCGICGLRMWGNHRRRSSYYSCQPSHQGSANIPADHPPSVYLGEPVLHEAVGSSCMSTWTDLEAVATEREESLLEMSLRIGYWPAFARTRGRLSDYHWDNLEAAACRRTS